MESLSDIFYFLGLITFAFHTLYVMGMTRYFYKKKIIKWWQIILFEDYFYFLGEYKSMTIKETGRVGYLYYIFYIALFLTIILAIGLIIYKFENMVKAPV